MPQKLWTAGLQYNPIFVVSWAPYKFEFKEYVDF